MNHRPRSIDVDVAAEFLGEELVKIVRHHQVSLGESEVLRSKNDELAVFFLLASKDLHFNPREQGQLPLRAFLRVGAVDIDEGAALMIEDGSRWDFPRLDRHGVLVLQLSLDEETRPPQRTLTT